jgi:hypothetical protein
MWGGEAAEVVVDVLTASVQLKDHVKSFYTVWHALRACSTFNMYVTHADKIM